MNVLIVEDEPYAQKELIRILQKVAPDCNILGVVDGIESAVLLISEKDPDLIFMDIQLSDGQSFEIFSLIKVKCPVIFTTAYDEYAMMAFKSNGIDYLLKPIEPEDVEKSLEKFRMITETSSFPSSTMLDPDKLKKLLKQGSQPWKTRFMTNIGDRIRFLNESEIAYFQADDEVVFMVSQDKRKYIINYTLETLEGQLDPAKFFRINRRYITHVESISDIHKHFNSRLKLMLNPSPDDEILVSRARVQSFLSWIGQ
jgi:two-component system, LytTR family, response regulator LytT